MSEIALDANCVASARCKDEQFLSMLKNHEQCNGASLSFTPLVLASGS